MRNYRAWADSADRIRDRSLSFPREKTDSIQQVFIEQLLSRSHSVRRDAVSLRRHQFSLPGKNCP